MFRVLVLILGLLCIVIRISLILLVLSIGVEYVMKFFMLGCGFGVGGDCDAVGFRSGILHPDKEVLEEKDAFGVVG